MKGGVLLTSFLREAQPSEFASRTCERTASVWQDDVGSTLFQTDRPYFKLDDETTLVSAKTDPVGFVRQIDTAIIDEVQRAPEASYRRISRVFEPHALRSVDEFAQFVHRPRVFAHDVRLGPDKMHAAHVADFVEISDFRRPLTRPADRSIECQPGPTHARIAVATGYSLSG